MVDGITIKIILGNLIEEKTECKGHIYEHFQLPCHTGFLQDPYVTLIDKTDPRAPTTRFIPIRKRHLWDLMLKVVTELLSYIVIEQLFLFLDLDGSRIIQIIVTFILFNH